MTSLLEKSFKANGWEIETETEELRELDRREEWGKGDASLSFIDGRTAILISNLIRALKEKNKDERE